jgi:hypothetical protein
VHHTPGGGYSVTHGPTGRAAGHFGRRKVAEAYAQHFGKGDGAATFSKAVAGDKAANKAMGAALKQWGDRDRSAVAAKAKGRRAAPPRPELPKKTLAQLGEERAKLPREAAPFLRSQQRVTGGRSFLGAQRYADVKWKGESYRISQPDGEPIWISKSGAGRSDEVPAPLRRRAEAILNGVVARQTRWREAESRMSERARGAFKRRTGRATFEVGGIA